MIFVFTDSDGVLKDSKSPVPGEIIEIIMRARVQHGIMVVRITGAPSHHLNDGLHVDRAFGESGGIEVLADGTVLVVPDARVAVDALQQLRVSLGIAMNAHDGHVMAPHGSFGLEGVRHTTLTLFFGEHPLYPSVSTDADPDAVAAFIQGCIESEDLPLHTMRGRSHTYEYIDVGHRDVMKKERTVRMILSDADQCERAYYLGDAGNDAGAMQLAEIIPVTFSNGTEEIKRIVRERNGILIDLPGPLGGSAEFFRRLIDGML